MISTKKYAIPIWNKKTGLKIKGCTHFENNARYYTYIIQKVIRIWTSSSLYNSNIYIVNLYVFQERRSSS